MKRSRAEAAKDDTSIPHNDADKEPASSSPNPSLQRRHHHPPERSNNKDEASPKNENPEEQVLSPHTLRLLKLVLEGTAEHAAEAATHLTLMAASCANKPTQLWEILGRLQEGLTSRTWKTRSQAARALQGVARELPTQDQIQFLQQRRRQQQEPEDAAVLLLAKECDTSITTKKLTAITAPKSATNGSARDASSYLTVEALAADNGAALEQVMTKGRLLMATSNERYKNDAEQEEALKGLDRSALARGNEGMTNHAKSSTGSDNDNDFLERRIQLQRRILAERLGLAGLGDVLGERNVLPESIISANELLNPQQQEGTKAQTESPEAKRRRYAQQVMHEKQIDISKIAGTSSSKADNSLSIRSLLVLQMQEQERRNRNRASDGTLSLSSLSHRNPQQLLATELVYRMFDPAWHVRHGALLGTLSLLRAWKTHQRRALASGSDDDDDNDLFGSWPCDILARCLCILGLDRFGDFSGALVSSAMTAEPSNAALSTGGVVAPVREVTGQLISVLFAMAPRSGQEATLELLFRLCEYQEEWEPRHGAFATLKFILVVMRTSSLPNGSQDDADWKNAVAERMAKVSIRHLGDESDDVVGAAAQVVMEFLGTSTSTIPPFVLKASTDLLHSLQTARSVSTSMVDLVELLALMLRIDAHSFLSSLTSSSNNIADGVVDLSKVLLTLLDSDFSSVRTSVLHSLGAFIDLLKPASETNEADNGLSTVASQVCIRLVEKLYEWYFHFSTQDDSTDETALSALRDLVWEKLTVLATRLRGRARDAMGGLELNLIQRYFWIDHDLLSQAEDTPFYSEASSALASFLVRGNRSPSGQSMVAIASLLHSPWTYHCEASSLLFKSVCTNSEAAVVGLEYVRAPLVSFLGQPPLCLIVNQVSSAGKVDRSFYDLCKKVFANEVSMYGADIQDPSVVVERIASVWKTMLQSRGFILPESFSKTTSVVTMRVEASIAGAVVSSGLPAKVTPVVRALMTSLKNESASRSRRVHVCADLSQLLKKMSCSTDYAVARTKVLGKICDLAVGEGVGSDPVIGDDSSSGPSRVLCLVCRSISSFDGLKEMQPLWSRISTILLHRENTDAELFGSAKLLRIVADSLGEGSSCLVENVIDTFAETLVRCSCEAENTAKLEASATLSALCSLNPDNLLAKSLPVVMELVGQQNKDSLRQASCALLKDLVDASGTSISLFVRALLPSVMKLMTDRNEDCARMANSLFAALVRVAPLVPKNAASSLKFEQGQESSCENVIDHLIFGLPLPPYKLPERVGSALEAGGIKLRAYQTEGISWLRFLQSVNLNGALCDSMGLGKTLQSLVAVAISHEDCAGNKEVDENARPISLVVCPSSVVGHWVAEVSKFSMQSIFQPVSYTGSSASRRAMRSTLRNAFNIVVTSYSVLRSDVDYLAGFDWRCCILDEGHLLSNPRTATARASKRLRALHKTILTGTPVQNKVNEVWAMFDFLMPNFLGTSNVFAREYARPILKSQQPDASAAIVKEGMTKLKLLHQQVLPFILRREKEQVLRELPPKNITTVLVPLSDLQQRIYKDFCATSEAKQSLSALEGALGDALVAGEKLGSGVLKSILFLRLLCTHPSMVLTTANSSGNRENWSDLKESGKFVALVQLLAEAGIYEDTVMAADNDSSLLYCADDADDDVSPPDSYSEVVSFQADVSIQQDSASARARPRSRCLIFSQFNATLDIVEELLFKQKMPSLRYMRLDGRVPMEKRAGVAEAFNRDESVSVMLLTTRVGGLGLNLTGADMVIFMESDFNPFVDLQAMDRAHRLGQKSTVNVYRIIMEGSIEEKILQLQEKKMAVSGAIVNSENSTMYQMGTERLLDIFSFNGSKDSGEAGGQGDYDLDALMERFAEDYSSLSVHDFAKTLLS